MIGKVKWFDPGKGFGFVQAEEGKDIFVHYSDIEKQGFKTLDTGQEVAFEVTNGPRGPQAIKVTVI